MSGQPITGGSTCSVGLPPASSIGTGGGMVVCGGLVAVVVAVLVVAGVVAGLVVVGCGGRPVCVGVDPHDVQPVPRPHVQEWTVLPELLRRVAVSPGVFQMYAADPQ